MESFELFNNWNKTIRWILFLPMLLIAYVISFYFGRFVIWWSYGWIGLNSHTGIGYIIYGFYQSFGCTIISFLISVGCVPKGKVVVGSIYLGLLLIIFGFDIFSLITYGPPSDLKTWQAIYSYVLTLIAAIVAFLSVLGSKSERIEKPTEQAANLTKYGLVQVYIMDSLRNEPFEDTWVIGENVTQDLVDKFYNEEDGLMYILRYYKDGEKKELAVTKEFFYESLNKMNKIFDEAMARIE